MASLPSRKGLSPRLSRRAIKPFPSVARLVRTQTSVNWASSQLRLKSRMLFDRAPIYKDALPVQTWLNSSSLARNPQTEWLGGSVLREERKTRFPFYGYETFNH